MVGTTISHYKILEKLGEGGMGVVYKAHDTRLNRDVALKFLPQSLSAHEPERARFLQEAQAAAALNHPHICAIHSIGEEGEQQYVEMEYVDGVTLRRKIEDGKLRIEDGIGYAIQIAEALQEAHCHGIVHRDIKADNIMVNSKNQVKVMDFGLAKLKGAVRLTRTTTTAGTAAYMSPEQAQGLEVDHRTDIWSLGVLLFEMLTGKFPFRGEHEAALMYSVVHEDPQALSILRPDIPHHVVRAVAKALEKDPSGRYQSADELTRDLKGSTVTIPTGSEEKSIVVLPFENISPDKENEYFADGLTEEVIADLSKVRSLKVISRTSAMKLKGTEKDLRAIGKQLGVRYVLEGSVRKAANAIRVTAQLIDAVSDAHLWAEKYNGTLENIFDIQERLSRQIVDELKVKLSPEESREIADRPIKNAQAYEYYLRARREIMLFAKSGVDSAADLLQAALDLEGENELLYFGLGFANWQYVNAGLSTDPVYLRKAEEYLEKINRISPDSHYGHHLRGLLALIKGDARVSILELKKAYMVDPNDIDTLLYYGAVTMFVGLLQVARPVIERLVQVDPLGSWGYLGLGQLCLFEGATSEGVKTLEHALQLEPDSPVITWLLGYALAVDGGRDEACRVLDRLDGPPMKRGNVLIEGLARGLKHALAGRVDLMVHALSQEVKDLARVDLSYSLYVAECYALVGLSEESLNWLEIAVDRGNFNYRYLAERDPLLANIRGEERFKKLMVRVKKGLEGLEE